MGLARVVKYFRGDVHAKHVLELESFVCIYGILVAFGLRSAISVSLGTGGPE